VLPMPGLQRHRSKPAAALPQGSKHKVCSGSRGLWRHHSAFKAAVAVATAKTLAVLNTIQQLQRLTTPRSRSCM